MHGNTQHDGRGWTAPLVVVAIALLAVLPAAVLGYPPNSDDVHYHVIYAEQFLRQVIGGDFYPRWLLGMNDGLGSPIFFFYGPVPYFVTSLCGLLTGARHGLALLAEALFVILPASGLAAFAWLRRLTAQWPAAIGASLYVAMPYHLTIDLWTRSAFAEFTAYMWTPLLFLAIEWIRARRFAGILLFAPAFALLIATHIITAMLVCGAIGFYALVRFRTLVAFGWLGLATAWGAALSAAYLGTALGLRSAVVIPVGALPRAAFMLSGAAPPLRRALWHALDALVVAEFAAAILLLASTPLLRRVDRRLAAAWDALTLLLLLGTTIVAMPVWAAVPPLHNAQYPFRLNTIADLGFATLAALLAAGAAGRLRRPARAAGVALAAIAAVGALQVVVPMVRSGFDPARANGSAAYARQSDSSMFRPVASMHRLPFDATPAAPVAVPAAQVVAGQAVLTLQDIRPRRLVFAVDASSPATVVIRQLYFPGWQADTGSTIPTTRPSHELGLVEADLPAGRYTLRVVLAPSLLERGGWLLSCAALGAWLAACLLRIGPHLRGRREAASRLSAAAADPGLSP